ncbi:MAG: hypothetical protein JWM10_136 [Myxococcaceae bacterium]|nr:hypothetical protein [Myxococcaceae bacterium]
MVRNLTAARFGPAGSVAAGSARPVERLENLLLGREAPALELREDPPPVDEHLERPTRARHHRRVDPETSLDCGCETRSPWLVVSDEAELDADLHRSPPSRRGSSGPRCAGGRCGAGGRRRHGLGLVTRRGRPAADRASGQGMTAHPTRSLVFANCDGLVALRLPPNTSSPRRWRRPPGRPPARSRQRSCRVASDNETAAGSRPGEPHNFSLLVGSRDSSRD